MTFQSLSYQLQFKSTEASWNAPFRGSYHEVLARTIRDMKSSSSTTYAPILPIIQSSGTGKSRVVHEVAGMIVALPLNIRSGDTKGEYDALPGYPAEDKPPRNFLTAFAYSEIARAKVTHLAFLMTMFDVASRYLLDMYPGKVYENEMALALDWRNHLEYENRNVRRQLHSTAIDESRKLISSIDKEFRGTDGRLREDAFAKLQARAQADGPDKLTAAILSRLSSGLRHPEIAVLVYVDEAHELAAIPCAGSMEHNFYDTFTKAFDCFRSSPVFLITISTNPIIRHSASLRLQAPYTELVWDCPLDDRPIVSARQVTLDDVAETSFMAKFGRPLFSTRCKAAEDGHYLRGMGDIVDFAFMKLTRYNVGFHLDDPWVLDRVPAESTWAPISTRLLLDWNPHHEKAHGYICSMITGHSRIAYSIPSDEGPILSGTPSEPLLAEAAALYMNEVKNSLDVTERVVALYARSLIDKGFHGELAARLLLLFAYDQAATQVSRTKFPWPTIRYSVAVPLITFLEELFAEHWHRDILSCTPTGSQDGAPSLRNAFDGAFVRFSHFVRSGERNVINTYTAFAAISRGMAFQLRPGSDVFDIAIPVAMKDEPLHEGLMTYLFIRLGEPFEQIHDGLSTRELGRIFPHAENKHPVIFVNMHLEGARADSFRRPVRDTTNTPTHEDPPAEPAADDQSHPCYKITIAGCSPSVFRVVDKELEPYIRRLTGSPNAADTLEHDRAHDEGNLNLVRRLKPEWGHGLATYDWIDDPALTEDDFELVNDEILTA